MHAAPALDVPLTLLQHKSTHRSFSMCLDRVKFIAQKDYRTPWSAVLLENLTVSQLVKKCPAFHGIVYYCTLKLPPTVSIHQSHKCDSCLTITLLPNTF